MGNTVKGRRAWGNNCVAWCNILVTWKREGHVGITEL